MQVFGPFLAASLEPLALLQNVGITFVDVYLNWLNWLHFLIFEGGLFVTLIDCITFCHHHRCYKGVYVNSFFPLIARL